MSTQPQTETKSDNKTPTVFHKLPPLPYALNALEPHITQLMMDFHYNKHHQAYVNNLNKLAETNQDFNKPVEELIKSLDRGKPFNQAAQIFNHTFYWNSMTPPTLAPPGPSAELMKQIVTNFTSFDNFKALFSAEAAGHFGSGWAWLIVNNKNDLEIISTHDAGNPLSKFEFKGEPILACDIWEHAYYIDFKNDRTKYINTWWLLVNWDFANKNFARATMAKKQ